jgi:mRNA interferase MazF
VRRGEIWTAAGGPDYSGKPRPVAIVQDDRFDTDSVTICPFTTDPTEAPLFRIEVTASATNGLQENSRLMVDKLTTVSRSKLGAPVGRLDDEDQVRLNRAMIVFLGIASSTVNDDRKRQHLSTGAR